MTMKKFLDYEGLTQLVKEQDGKYVLKGWETEAISEGSIHGLFVETMSGGVKYNGSRGDWTITGLTSAEGIEVDSGEIKLPSTVEANGLHYFGGAQMTITIGETTYRVSEVDSDTANGYELIETE